MELHQQQQQNFHPDVLPTPSSLDEVQLNAKSNYGSASKRGKSEVSVSKESNDGSQMTAGRGPVITHYVFSVGQYPVFMTCPHCRQSIITQVLYQISTKQYILCIVLCICVPLPPCSLLPCLFRSWYDVNHFCPQCGQLIGRYEG